MLKKTSKAVVEEAMAQVTRLTPSQARTLHGTAGAQWVHVEDLHELEHEGLLPEGSHVPLGMQALWDDASSFQRSSDHEADKEEYVLFQAADWRSVRTTRMLMDAGLTEAAQKS